MYRTFSSLAAVRSGHMGRLREALRRKALLPTDVNGIPACTRNCRAVPAPRMH